MSKGLLICFICQYVIASGIFAFLKNIWLSLYFIGASILTIAILGGMNNAK